MNQLACIYLESPEHLSSTLSHPEFQTQAGKFRTSFLFGTENADLQAEIAAGQAASVKSTALIHIHECITPYLIIEYLSGPLGGGREIPVLARPHSLWINEVDVWFNLPQDWESLLKPLMPHAYFYRLQTDVPV